MSWKDHRVVTFNGSRSTRKDTSEAYRTISLGEIWSMLPGDKPKERAGAILQSSHNGPDGRTHKVQREKGSFSCICLDIDTGNHDLDHISGLLREFWGSDVATFIYTSSSATEAAKKYRAMIPLEQKVPYQEWLRLMEACFAFMADQGVTCDRALARAGQPVFLPNVPRDKRDENGAPLFYCSAPTEGGGATSAGGVAPHWLDRLQKAPTAIREVAEAMRAMLVQNRDGPIDRFNRINPLRDMLTSCGYKKSPSQDANWRSRYQTSKSFATCVRTDEVGDEYFITLSASDAAAGIGKEATSGCRYGDSFDLFVHYRHAGDFPAAIKAISADPVLEPPRPGRFQLRTAEEMANLPPVKWLVQGVLPAEGVAAVYGPPGSGKSFLVLDIMGAVARGGSWGRHKTSERPCTYVALEGEAGIGQRVKANMLKLGPLPLSIRFVAAPLNLQKAQDIVDLAAAINGEGLGNGVICIDTFNRASPGADENDSKDMGYMIEATKELQRLFGGLIILVHHSGKDTSKGLRGHSSLFAALDVAIEVSKNAGQFSWRVKKSKDGRDDHEGAFRLETVELGVDDTGYPISSCVVVAEDGVQPIAKPLNPTTQQAVDAYVAIAPLRGAWQGGKLLGVALSVWRDEAYRGSLADSEDAKRKSFGRARSSLQKMGALTVDGDLNLLKLPATTNIQPSLEVLGKAIEGRDMRDNSGTVPGQFQGH